MPKHFSKLFPLLLLIFIDSFGYFIIIPILLEIYFNNPFGILPTNTTLLTRNFLTGFTISFSTLAAILASPIIGSVSDRFGRKKTLLFCLIMSTIGFIIPIIGIKFKSVSLILLGRFLGGVGSASQPVAQASVADFCKNEEKSIAFSYIAFAMTLSLLIGPFAGGYLSDIHWVSWFNATTPYWFATMLSLFNFVLIIFYYQETHLTSSMRKQMITLKEVCHEIKHALQNYHIGLFLLSFFLLELAWSLYYQSIGLFLSQYFHESVQNIGLFTAYLGVLMSVALVFVYPTLIRFIALNKLMRISFYFVGLGAIGVALTHNILLHIFFASLIPIFTGIAYVALITLISNKIPNEEQGWGMGTTSMVVYSAWFISGVTSGWLLSWQLFLPFDLAAIILIGSIILLWRKRSC